ncbi:helix-turn-helix domain-containing protein [Gracilibacillus thailandensis]|uniref:Helix-turn-helix domain-containing protein n=1 Tax=Gracilibacillus thailandensis TaxID=563735 RepID=A0A6N7QTA0_9BACI|nr:helix-turn-helix domain-containing protein [Gracilibacillus thailandensis]
MTNEQVKLIRLYNAKSQAQFAKEIGVGASTIAKIEVGLHGVTERVRSRILRKYDVNEPEFVAFCERMTKAI